VLREHARRAGRLDRLRDIELRLDRYEKDLQASRAERCEVTARDPSSRMTLEGGAWRPARGAWRRTDAC